MTLILHTFFSFSKTVKRKRKHGIDALVSELLRLCN